MSAASSPELVPIFVGDLSSDSELSELSELSSPDSSVSSSTASSTPPPDPDHFETRLWRHFPGWVWSERSKDNHSWAWEYGYHSQRHDERRWVCKRCIQKNDPKPKSFVAVGLQNALNHLYRDHRISAPDNKTKSGLQQNADKKPGSKRLRSIVDSFKLDPSNSVTGNCQLIHTRIRSKSLPTASDRMDGRYESTMDFDILGEVDDLWLSRDLQRVWRNSTHYRTDISRSDES